MATLLSGALFGPSLLYSGVASPNSIQSQLSLSDFHMLRTFLTASALSATIAYLSQQHTSTPQSPRSPSPLLRHFTRYDANFAGGLLQGIGMALSGACPGTGLVQAGVGLRSGVVFVLGGMCGAGIFRGVMPVLKARPQAKSKGVSKDEAGPTPTLTRALHLSPLAALLLWQALCLGAVYATSSAVLDLPASRPLEHAVRGGLAIGAAQAASVLLRGAMVGVSGGYAQVLEAVLGVVSGKGVPGEMDAARFAVGVLAGAAVLGAAVPALKGVEVVEVGLLKAFVGGVLQIFGARLAGGCTSGHGISGMATFGLASFVSVAAIFGGGIGFSLLFG